MSIKSTARLAGLLYFVMAILDVLGYLYAPAKFLVAGNAAATVAKITADPLLYRALIATSLIGQILFIFVVLTLYQLFENVGRAAARLMVVLVCIGVAGEFVAAASRMSPLFVPDVALAYSFLRVGGTLNQILTVFWGLWLFPFGILTIKSRFLPKILGILLIVAGVGYVVSCFTYIVFPASLRTVSRIVMPLYFGELPIIFWLLLVGAKEPVDSAATWPLTQPTSR